VIGSDDSWTASSGPIITSGLYAGERFDARREPAGWSGGADRRSFEPSSWSAVRVVPFDLTTLTGFDGPFVRCTEELTPIAVTELPGGRHLLDFGQNISGRQHLSVQEPNDVAGVSSHAEVLQDGELCRRPLRDAESIDEYILAGTQKDEQWEPRFTIHGFRYAEIQGWTGGPIAENVIARVYHSDMQRTGWFDSSNDLVNRLHENVVWSMRGNFVDIPTDCPQRDERLGWTGDIQVFAPTASFLYDCSGFLSSWLKDLAAEQLDDGTVPWYVPVIPGGDYWTPIRPGAAWGDAAVLTPWTLWERFGDREVLERQYESARAWVHLIERISGDDHLWNTGMQLGDWLDPAAPPDDPADSLTDRYLVATAYAAASAGTLARAAAALGRGEDRERYERLASDIRDAFVGEYLRADGRLTSDTATAYSLAIVFGLLPDEALTAAGRRLAEIVSESAHTITTGFVGTPIVTEALSRTGHTDTAYALLLEEKCPSWMYAVLMGGTTIWERWDSMLPDGTVNPGGMTSFNHYALGAVADWLHRRVAGLESVEPGYRVVRFRPQPGGNLTWASARHISPYGEYAIRWDQIGDLISVNVTVPTGGGGLVELPGLPVVTVGPGTHTFTAPRFPADESAG
jgi:alpha-L-rhamnosidase